MTEEPTRRGAMLNLVVTNKEGLVQNVKLVGSLGCSDTGMAATEGLKAVSKEHSRLRTLGSRKADQPLQGSAWLSIIG